MLALSKRFFLENYLKIDWWRIQKSFGQKEYIEFGWIWNLKTFSSNACNSLRSVRLVRMLTLYHFLEIIIPGSWNIDQAKLESVCTGFYRCFEALTSRYTSIHVLRMWSSSPTTQHCRSKEVFSQSQRQIPSSSWNVMTEFFSFFSQWTPCRHPGRGSILSCWVKNCIEVIWSVWSERISSFLLRIGFTTATFGTLESCQKELKHEIPTARSGNGYCGSLPLPFQARAWFLGADS